MTAASTGQGRRRSRHLRLAASLLVSLTAIAVWFQRPFGPGDAEGVVRLSGSCCARTTGAPNDDVPVLSPRDDNGLKVGVRFGNLVWGYGAVHGDVVDLNYEVWKSTPRERSASGRFSDYEVRSMRYTAAGLRVGDVRTHGPVTIEVVAIHDMILNRNNAVDLRVTIDQTRLAEAP